MPTHVVTCPHCGQECAVEIREGLTYARVKCPACKKTFMARVKDGNK